MESISIDVNHHPFPPDSTTLRVTGFLYANTLVQLDKVFQSVMASMKKSWSWTLPKPITSAAGVGA